MTFYNIIFGLLFIGAFREVIYALAQGPDWRLFCLTATLSVLVFADTIYTSVVIEGKNNEYSIVMKLLDLWSFILLSFAVVILNPATNDMFEVNVTDVLSRFFYETGATPEALFWCLLSLYIFNLIIWNELLGVRLVMWRHRWVNWVQPAVLALFTALAVIAWRSPDADDQLYYARWAVLALVVAYLVRFKTYMSDVLDRIVTLKPLTDADVAAIRKWPPYPKPIAALDYALRPGGWLELYPESPVNVRYGMWQKGKLVGFTLLTDMRDGDAEFYIALHPHYTRRHLGREGTEQTIRLAFRVHKLDRVHLKVRDWYEGARRLYARVGFRETGVMEAPVQGQPVKFVRMEMERPRTLKERWIAFLAGFRLPASS